jgi:flagellar secretion chaperone FliS
MASSQAYRQNSVLSASPAQLVVELYDGARRFLRQAADAMSERDVERAHLRLRRAEMIIDHLDGVIDDQQGEVSSHLHALYAVYLSHLNEARRAQDPAKVREVARMLGKLRDTWLQISESAEGAA